MDENDIDTLDVPLRPKIKPVFKRKPTDTNISSSSSRRVGAVQIEEEKTMDEKTREESNTLIVPWVSHVMNLGSKGKQSLINHSVSSQRNRATGTDHDDSSVDEAKEQHTGYVNPTISRVIKSHPRFKKKPVNSGASQRTRIATFDNGDEGGDELSTIDPLREPKVDPIYEKKPMSAVRASFLSREAGAIPIDNGIENNEDEGEEEEVEIRIKPSLTSQTRAPNDPSKRRLNLSKYKAAINETDEQGGNGLEKELAKKMTKEQFKGLLSTPQLTSDIEDPEDNPIVVDIGKFNVSFSPGKETSSPPDIKNLSPKPGAKEPPRSPTPLLDFDSENSENNPVIANIDELDFKFSPQKEPSIPPNIEIPLRRSKRYEPPTSSTLPYSPKPSLPRSYVPIHSNAEPQTISKRQYLNQIASEYNDDKNYDDGAPSSTNKELQQPDFDPDSRYDYELSDEDMGVLKAKRNIDFEHKYNDEIVSDYGSSDDDGFGRGYGRSSGFNGYGNDGYMDYASGYGYINQKSKPKQQSHVKVFTIQEQITRIEERLKLECAKQKQKEAVRANLLKRKEEIQQQRDALIQKLQDWKL